MSRSLQPLSPLETSDYIGRMSEDMHALRQRMDRIEGLMWGMLVACLGASVSVIVSAIIVAVGTGS